MSRMKYHFRKKNSVYTRQLGSLNPLILLNHAIWSRAVFVHNLVIGWSGFTSIGRGFLMFETVQILSHHSSSL